ncbi:toprim domain-containing protein [Isosphaeraceae bacterium EP7]
MAYLTERRFLSHETIRAAYLGWTPGVRLTTTDGRPYSARGIVIPWVERDRLTLVKIRQHKGDRPKYAEVFRDRPFLYPDPEAIRFRYPLIIVEGEFDALLLGQALAGLASVMTMGSASARHDHGTVSDALRPARRIYIATDADDAGDRAAEGWPARARRVRPPDPFKDWTEARQGGVDLARWWADLIEKDARELT